MSNAPRVIADPRQRDRGSIALAMLLLTSIVLVGGPFFTIGITQSHLQSIAADRMMALAVAEAGVQEALWEFNHDGGTFPVAPSGAWVNGSDPSGGLCPSGTCRQQSFAVANAAGVEGGTSGTATVYVKDFSTSTPTVISLGQANGSAMRTRVVVTLQAPPVGGNPFTGALVSAQQTIGIVDVPASFQVDNYNSGGGAITPSLVDAYDSRIGSYGVGGNWHSSAGLAGIGNFNATITDSGAIVYGNVTGYNTGAAPSVTVINGATLTGAAVNGGTRSNLPPVQWPASCTNPPLPAGCTDSSGQLVVSLGSTCTLPPGQYCYPNGAHIEGTLSTSGKVEIYAGNNTTNPGVFVGSALIAPPAQVIPYQNLPSNLRIYSVIQSTSSRPFMFTHAGTIMGIFYRDPTQQSTGSWIDYGVEFSGSMVDNNIRVSASRVHYDQALAALTDLPSWLVSGGSSSSGYTVTSWTRKSQ